MNSMNIMLENLQKMTRHNYEQLNIMLENLQNMSRHIYGQYEYHVRKLTEHDKTQL